MNNLETEKLINNIKTSMEMENQFLSDKELNVLADFANNRVSFNEANEVFKKMSF